MGKSERVRKKFALKKLILEIILVGLAAGVLFGAVMVFWMSSIDLPDFNDFENRAIVNSTKIYDRTGKVVLYNIHDSIRRTEVPLEEVSLYIRQATVAIEDSHFYEHHGVRPMSIARAMIANVKEGSFSQGGSTITQQVVKNALLTREKTITRKIKEWLLAFKLDAQVSKDKILEIYLNESPYGGTLYGVEEASLSFFGKRAKDITLVEASYLAALPQSPTYYSPFGKHKEELEARKNLVLERMYILGYITEEERINAQNEVVVFSKDATNSGKALHFVFYVREYLEQKYGIDTVLNGGLRIITTIDYELQQKLEEIVRDGAIENDRKFKASNSSLVAIDPKSGQILAMVGSRNFFDEKIPGQYNIATANRQPGSSFKPIVYAAAFEKGYTPETVLFDVPTQFSALCDPYGTPRPGVKKEACYMPQNYDDKFRGPISLRGALSQSLNVPSVKLLYLTGITTAMNLAQRMGLSTIKDPSRYGLSLVLGGGEVTLLELTNAYGVFANNGIYSKEQGILEIRDINNEILEKFTPAQSEVLPEDVTSLISSILSDDASRSSQRGPLYFEGRPVAAKTGTTNDYRDLWVIGYTPSIVIGMWAGNNNNAPIDKRVAGFVLAPVWHKAMAVVLDGKAVEYFPEPLPNTSTKPILQGEYCSGGGAQTILAHLDKNNPNGSGGTSINDAQYNLWNTPIQTWVSNTGTCGYAAPPSPEEEYPFIDPNEDPFIDPNLLPDSGLDVF